MHFVKMGIPLNRFQVFGFLMLFLLSGQISFAQSSAPIEWTRPNLLWPDSTWKYQGGIAKQEWFDQHFDDSHWQTVDANFLHIPLAFAAWQGIGVFRKKFNVPDSLRGQMVELMINQLGASAIYLDGRLITRFGKASGDAKQERTRLVFVPRHPVQIALDSQSSHVLSVYYSSHTPESFLRRYGIRGFEIMLSASDPDGRETNSTFPHDFVSVFIILGFCLFFCFVYGFYPYRLASLMSAIFLAGFSLLFIGNIIANHATDIRYLNLGINFWRISFSCQAGLYLLFLYSLYYGRMPKRSWIVLALIIIAAVYGIIPIEYPFGVITPMIALFQIDTWRILILGIRRKRTGFWILAIGMFISILVVLFAIFNLFHFFPWYLTDTQIVFSIFTDLSFPLTLALQFALEFGSANRDLRKQLAQVNDLSRKNLEQEKEKQQILSMQNVTLEKQVSERTAEVVAQNKEIEKQRDQVTNTLEELRTAQKQLIQSEKMASLGELTAGIAHEIQNPLNFVNNFSEVNQELIDELEREVDKGNLQEARTIAKDIKENEEKINHHGKRADSIVKGMLQHSKSSSGTKSYTDLNALADEYLRLAYHGLRAKEKALNSAMKTNYDESVGKVNMVSQDIARVLLNLYNNAFYAVKEKLMLHVPGYEPIVEVSTRKKGDMVTVAVRDNGCGIPQKIMEKIFQPFFTTKPTGQGTGLGLSLSYDIIKAHGGEINVDSREEEFTEFVIQIPA